MMLEVGDVDETDADLAVERHWRSALNGALRLDLEAHGVYDEG